MPPPVNGISLNGNDYLVIAGRLLTDFAGETAARFTFPNDIATVDVGKNGNAVIALNNRGKQMDGEINLLLGSGDDQFLTALEASFELDPPSFELLSVQFTKRSGDGSGDVINKLYLGQGGIFKKKAPETMDGSTGQSEQGIAKWEFMWPQSIIAIQ